MNYKVSTIDHKDLIPVATEAVAKFIKSRNQDRLLRYFGSHITMEDLVMDAVEKVLQADPNYLTKSYVYTAARCVCIDRLQQKKIPWAEVQSLVTFEDGDSIPIEELLVADTADHLRILEDFVDDVLEGIELQVFNGLRQRKLYTEIAKDTKVSLRTVERTVQNLKWKIAYLLYGEDIPDDYK